MKKSNMFIPIFIPHKGCPFDCIYCDQKSISGETQDMTSDRMISIVEDYLHTSGPKENIEIAFYGGSFTGIDKQLQIELLNTASKYVESGKVSSIRLSTRPDYIDDSILEYLKKYHVGTIELGVQSLDEDVLKQSCRGHSVSNVLEASGLIKKWGIKLGIQTMIGLPGDTEEKDIYTAQKVADIKPAVVRIYPTLVIKGTYLERMFIDGSYKPLTLDEAVGISAVLLSIYNENGIKVIRIGLQPTEDINLNAKVTAGPFHPSFGQLVQSKLMLDKINKIIIEKGYMDQEKIIINTSPANISNVVGQKSSNLVYLKNKYGFKDIKVTGSLGSDVEITIGI